MTEAERAALAELEAEHVQIRRGGSVVAEGERGGGPYIVREGWLRSSVLLGNGGRQIIRLSLPGDLVGLAGLTYPEAPETICALTNAVLCPVDRQRLAGLFTDHPRLAAFLFALTAAESTLLADRLASVGRTPARARIAYLLCDLFARVRESEPAADSFHLPLTQEEMGDATGLTAVHVNRMIRGLVDDGIIERRNSTVRLLSEERLVAEANCVARRRIVTGWLPPAA